MKTHITRIVSLLILLCISACTTVLPQTEFYGNGKLMPGDTVVLLSNLKSTRYFDDNDVDKCIGSAMRQASPELILLPAKKFRDNLYPYFMPSTTPNSLEGYKKILDKEEVQQRIAPLRIRYLVMLVKNDTVTDWHGGIICGGGYGGGGCLGLSWWNRKSDFSFLIWDLKHMHRLGKVGAKSAGTGLMPAFGLPIPLYVPATESAVCKNIGTRFAELLSGRQ